MRKENMKKIILPVLIASLALSGCSKSSLGMTANDGGVYYETTAAQSVNSASKSEGFWGGAAETAPAAAADGYYEYEEAEINSDGVAGNSALDKANNTSEDVIKKEMLVYSCSMTVDVLDFENAIKVFKQNLSSYGAFVENENYSDGGSTGHWQYNDTVKWQTYNATVRVPSESYESFCEGASGLGDLRSKNANVQNMSREYYDLAATLEIYEAKENRYMELLSTIYDEEYAIQVERELTDVQIEIAKIKTRMNDIRTDVAYSYVYITINEVREYQAEPVKTDTFWQRLGNTVSDSAKNFLSFMEGLLFALIYLFPHLVIIGLIVFAIIKIVKSAKKKKAAKKAAQASAMQTAQTAAAGAPVVSAPVSAPAPAVVTEPVHAPASAPVSAPVSSPASEPAAEKANQDRKSEEKKEETKPEEKKEETKTEENKNEKNDNRANKNNRKK